MKDDEERKKDVTNITAEELSEMIRKVYQEWAPKEGNVEKKISVAKFIKKGDLVKEGIVLSDGYFSVLIKHQNGSLKTIAPLKNWLEPVTPWWKFWKKPSSSQRLVKSTDARDRRLIKTIARVAKTIGTQTKMKIKKIRTMSMEEKIEIKERKKRKIKEVIDRIPQEERVSSLLKSMGFSQLYTWADYNYPVDEIDEKIVGLPGSALNIRVEREENEKRTICFPGIITQLGCLFILKAEYRPGKGFYLSVIEAPFRVNFTNERPKKVPISKVIKRLDKDHIAAYCVIGDQDKPGNIYS